MRCAICDKTMSEAEISFSTEINTFEPCSTCLEVIMETAFSEGYHRPDENEVAVEIGDEFGDGEVEMLDVDTNISDFQFGDTAASNWVGNENVSERDYYD